MRVKVLEGVRVGALVFTGVGVRVGSRGVAVAEGRGVRVGLGPGVKVAVAGGRGVRVGVDVGSGVTVKVGVEEGGGVGASPSTVKVPTTFHC
jgi:hypothetical protein